MSAKDAQIADLRQQLDALKESFAARLTALERRDAAAVRTAGLSSARPGAGE